MTTRYLIFSAAQANLLRGLTVAGHALAPLPLANGNFALPEGCKSDPYQSSRSSTLNSIPALGVTTIDPSTDHAIWAQCIYNSTWPVGQLITV